MKRTGWYQIAYEREVTDGVTPAYIGDLPLALVRTDGAIRVVDAICPHRGANLAFGGKLDGDAIVCPFHSYRISLDCLREHDFTATTYRSLTLGGLVFVELAPDHDNGFTQLLQEFDVTHYFVPGFSVRVGIDPEWIIENAFDNSHFRSVHKVRNEPRFKVLPSQRGELSVEGVFQLPPSQWQASPTEGDLQIPFVARAFSPGIIVSSLAGDHPYSILTAATPQPGGGSLVRLSLIVPPGADGAPPKAELCQYLLRQSQAGLEQDRLIWDHLDTTRPPQYTAQDAAVLAFRDFCAKFYTADAA